MVLSMVFNILSRRFRFSSSIFRCKTKASCRSNEGLLMISLIFFRGKSSSLKNRICQYKLLRNVGVKFSRAFVGQIWGRSFEEWRNLLMLWHPVLSFFTTNCSFGLGLILMRLGWQQEGKLGGGCITGDVEFAAKFCGNPFADSQPPPLVPTRLG